MAAGMGFNFASLGGKYMNSPLKNSGLDFDISRDLHTKMSKKIAQLTKVRLH